MKVNMKKLRLSLLTNLQTKGANTMLEKMFTTKMSMDKKKLQNRFSKIRSKNGKTSKFIALAVFAVIIVSIICVSIWVAVSRQDDMILYENEAMNFKLEIPLSWQGKYIVDESAVDDNYIAFKHKRIAEKHDGMGTLFSVIKLPDSEIDEYMNMVGNMTVVWRNQDYGYLIGRPTDVQVPIFAGNDEEDIKLAEEYQKMYKDVSNIETTFSVINDVGTPNIINAENLSYAQIKDLQRQVDNGHFPWRMDYEQVIQMYLSGKGINVEDGEIIAFAGDGEGCSATYSVDGNAYLVDLFKPIEKSEHGIWVVRSFEKKNSAIIREVFFYKATPEQPMIEKEDDGWYKMSSVIDAHFQYEGEEPDSVIAYFIPTGTEMDDYKKEVGKIAAPYTYMTNAKVLSMQLQFPKDATIGHLHFVFNYEDGEEVKSEYYNVLMESYASEGKAELFKYGDLELEVTNVINKKKQTASDGFETWEYDVYVLSKGARVFVNNADMFYDDNKKVHPNWAFNTENEERINIVSGMKPIEITSDVKGVYDPESSVYVLMFEIAE